MNGDDLHFAMRQLRARFRDPVTLAVLAGISLVVGVSGPFETFTALSLLERLAYWALVVPLTYAVGFVASLVARPHLATLPQWLRIALASLASALAVCLTLLALNLSLGLTPFDAKTLAGGFAAVYVISVAVEALGALVAAQNQASPDNSPPALLLRLPIDKRGALICLTVQDHYVEVTTTKGRALILMRLSDAISETKPIEGFQSHRSHWVALSHVTKAHRQGDAAILILSNGVEIPVARTRIKAAHAAGLLPHGKGT